MGSYFPIQHQNNEILKEIDNKTIDIENQT